jgi:N-methylhydantoinase A
MAQDASNWRVGIDAGGTFTDVMAIDSRGAVRVVKVPSTPAEPVAGPINGIEAILRQLEPGARVIDVAHGTTVGLNALLQRRFPPVALLVTRGFRHVLEIARHTVPGPWGAIYSWVKPERVVPLEHVFELDERLDAEGRVLKPLDETQVTAIAEQLRERGFGSIAVCLLHAYRNPVHEQRVKAVLERVRPDWLLSISHEVMPEFREYERMVTTATNAVLAPLIGRYMDEFDRRARHALDRDEAQVYVMRSAGGVVTAREAARQPLRTALSGPAGGVLGMARLAQAAGFPKAITFDMGGTSTDVAAVEDGQVHLTHDAYIDIFPLRTPTVDLVTIGAGGGSVIWLGTADRLRVGPQSTGADPGPACYRKGGKRPAITDANLLMGRVPDTLVGGSFPLDGEAARRALSEVGSALGLDAEQVAFSALEIAANNMAGAVREVSVRRGLDPREYTLVAFGGAGPLHACRMAELVGIPRVLVPPHPGLGSCVGLLLADIVLDASRTVAQRDDQADLEFLGRMLTELEAQVEAQARTQGVDSPRVVRFAEVHYIGSGSELSVPMPEGPATPELLAATLERFHTEHERRYGFCYRHGQRVELVSVRVEARGTRAQQVPSVELPPPESRVTRSARRAQLTEGEWAAIPVVSRRELPAGWHANGPMFIDQYDTTTVVLPGHVVRVDSLGNLLIERSEGTP